MSKNRPTPSSGKPPTRPGPRSAGSLPAFVRVVLSVLVVWHLAGVILAAWSIPPTSPLVVDLAQRPPMQWYLDALYLNHGYRSFAPDPDASHLIRYEVFNDSGGVVHQGEFPSRKDQWPRLRYDRYLMLADQAEPPGSEEADRSYLQQQYLEAYARQLLREHPDGASVRVRQVAHYPLFPDHAQEGRKLDDPETYKTLLEAVQRRSDLGPEDAIPRDPTAYDQQTRTGAATGWESVAGRRGWQGGVR